MEQQGFEPFEMTAIGAQESESEFADRLQRQGVPFAAARRWARQAAIDRDFDAATDFSSVLDVYRRFRGA